MLCIYISTLIYSGNIAINYEFTTCWADMKSYLVMLNRELLFETGFTGFQFTNSSTIVAYVFVDKAVESELLRSQLNELISFGKNIAFFLIHIEIRAKKSSKTETEV